MKFKIFFFAFTLLGVQAYSQSKNTVSVVYGIASNSVNIHGSIGDFGYNTRSGMTVGLTFSHMLNRSISLETGLLFSDNKTQETYIIPGIGEGILNGSVKMISVPVFIKYNFLKYFYVGGGALVDKQTNYTNNTTLNDQSGIGFEFGVGGKYSFNKFTVFINPYFSEHGLATFSDTGSSFNLLEAGVKVGFGYNF